MGGPKSECLKQKINSVLNPSSSTKNVVYSDSFWTKDRGCSKQKKYRFTSIFLFVTQTGSYSFSKNLGVKECQNANFFEKDSLLFKQTEQVLARSENISLAAIYSDRIYKAKEISEPGSHWTMDNGQWTMDNGQWIGQIGPGQALAKLALVFLTREDSVSTKIGYSN